MNTQFRVALCAALVFGSCVPPLPPENEVLTQVTCVAAAVSPVAQYLNAEQTRKVLAGDADLVDLLVEAKVAKPLVDAAQVDVAVCY